MDEQPDLGDPGPGYRWMTQDEYLEIIRRHDPAMTDEEHLERLLAVDEKSLEPLEYLEDSHGKLYWRVRERVPPPVIRHSDRVCITCLRTLPGLDFVGDEASCRDCAAAGYRWPAGGET